MKIFEHYRGLSRGIYIVSLSKLVQTMGAFIWPLFTLILTSKIGLNIGETTIYVTVGMILSGISSLAGGYFADHFGSKVTLVVGEALAIIAFGLIVFNDIGMITVYLLMAGMFFFSLTGPAHEALMANVTKTEERESAYSLHYLALNIGIIIGPSVGGLLLKDHFNLFIGLDVLTTFLGLMLILFFVHEDRNKETENELEAVVTDSIWKILKDRPVIIWYGLLVVFMSFTYGQLNFGLPLYLKSLFDNHEAIYGFLYGFDGLVVVLFTSLLIYVLRKVSAMKKILIGFIMYVSMIFLLAYIEVVPLFFVMMFIFTVGEVIISVGSSPIMSKLVPANTLGKIAGAMTIFYMLGHLASTVVPGILLDQGMSFKGMWLSVGTISLIGLVYFYFFKRRFGAIIDSVDSLDKNRA